jgi:hypothetical protein
MPLPLVVTAAGEPIKSTTELSLLTELLRVVKLSENKENLSMEGPGTNNSDILLVICNSWKSQDIEAWGGMEVPLEKRIF